MEIIGDKLSEECWVRTDGGHKVFPSVGMTTYRECQDWLEGRKEPFKRDQHLKIDKSMATLQREQQMAEWCEFQIVDAYTKLIELRPKHPLVGAITVVLDSAQSQTEEGHRQPVKP